MTQAPAPVRGDDELLRRARTGDSDAFAELYQRHRPAARRLARALVDGRVEADDVVAEAFTRVLRALRAGNGPVDGFRVYLLTVVRRTAWYLANHADRSGPLDGVDLPLDGDDPVLASVERDLMADAFASLPERWRTVLWHTEVEGEPVRRVARLLGLSPNGAAALAYRARNALTAAYLQAHVATPPTAACKPVADRLGAYASGRVAEKDRLRVAAHLAGCADCRDRVAELRDVRTALRGHVGPIVLGPAVAGAYLAHGKLAVLIGAVAEHGKVGAAVAASGAMSGEAVLRLADAHQLRPGAAASASLLAVAGALGLVVTGPTAEVAAPRVPAVYATSTAPAGHPRPQPTGLAPRPADPLPSGYAPPAAEGASGLSTSASSGTASSGSAAPASSGAPTGSGGQPVSESPRATGSGSPASESAAATATSTASPASSPTDSTDASPTTPAAVTSSPTVPPALAPSGTASPKQPSPSPITGPTPEP